MDTMKKILAQVSVHSVQQGMKNELEALLPHTYSKGSEDLKAHYISGGVEKSISFRRPGHHLHLKGYIFPLQVE